MFKALNTLASQFKCQHDYVSLKRDFSVVAGIFAAADFGNLSKAQRAEVEKHIDRLKSFVSRICQSVQSTAYPFDHSRGEITLSQYLAPNGLKLVDMTSTCETSATILQNYDSAYIRSIGVLSEGVLRTEEYLDSVPRESLLQDAAALSQRPETSSTNGFSNPPAIPGAADVAADDNADVIDASEIVDASEVIEIKSDTSPAIFDFSNAETLPAATPAYVSTSQPSLSPLIATETPKRSRKWIWILALGAIVLVSGGIAAVVIAAGKFLASGSKPKIYTKPTIDPSDIVHSTQRNFLYRWNTELPVSYELTITHKKKPDEAIARGKVSFTELTNSNADAKDPTEFSTGFLIDGGLVATTASSVLGSSQIAVFDSVRAQFVSASILAVDTEKNVALLTTQLSGPPVLKLASAGSSNEGTVNVLSVSGAGGPSAAMPNQLTENANTLVVQSSSEAPKLKQPMLDSEIGCPIVDSQGLVVGIVDVLHSSSESKTEANAKMITSREILDLLTFSKIDISRSGGRSWSNSSSPSQPVVRIRSYQKHPFKRAGARVKLVHSPNHTENFSGWLNVSQLGQLRASTMKDSSPPGMPSFAEMVFVPLDSMKQTEWVVQTASVREMVPARSVFGSSSSPSSISVKQSARYQVKNRDADRVHIEGDIETELGPVESPSITIKQHTVCEFNLELGIPEKVQHEFERREVKGRPLDWIITLKRVENSEK
ncbi:MAG: serine protease [Pirellulales bacterium]